jgi:transcriptional regulator with GAF, ATPase, and Fis domain
MPPFSITLMEDGKPHQVPLETSSAAPLIGNGPTIGGTASFEEVEHQTDLNAFNLSNGNLSAAARRLQTARPQRQFRLLRLKIEAPSPP